MPRGCPGAPKRWAPRHFPSSPSQFFKPMYGPTAHDPLKTSVADAHDRRPTTQDFRRLHATFPSGPRTVPTRPSRTTADFYIPLDCHGHTYGRLGVPGARQRCKSAEKATGVARLGRGGMLK